MNRTRYCGIVVTLALSFLAPTSLAVGASTPAEYAPSLPSTEVNPPQSSTVFLQQETPDDIIIVSCDPVAYAPAVYPGGLRGLASTTCNVPVKSLKTRVCLQSMSKATGNIGTMTTTCNPNSSGVSGCLNCAFTSKYSFAPESCLSMFKYRTVQYMVATADNTVTSWSYSMFSDPCS